MNVNYSSISGQVVEYGYTGAYTGGLLITTADDITDETATATFTLSTGTPSAGTLNGVSIGAITGLGSDVYEYTPPLIADDATATLSVTVDGDPITTTIGYANTYNYSSETGVTDTKSVHAGNTYNSADIEFKVTSDADPAVATVDWAAIQAANDWLGSIEPYTTFADTNGSTSVTFDVLSVDTLETGTYSVALTIDSYDIVMSQLTTPPVKRPVSPFFATAPGLRGVAAGQRTIAGTGFGSGPNVVLFDRFDGADEALVDMAAADIGGWDTIHTVTVDDDARYARYEGRGWFSGRDPTKIANSTHSGAQLTWVTATAFSEFRFAHRLRVPDGFINPGSDTAGVHGTSSGWKPVWFAQNDGGQGGGYGNDGEADLVIPSHIGNGTMFVNGNSNNPRILSPSDTGLYSDWSFTSDNFYSYYQGDESVLNAEDAPMEWLGVGDSHFNFNKGIGDPWRDFDAKPTVRSYGSLRASAYYGNQPGSDWTNVWPLHGDIYLAVGPNSRACIMTGNAATLAACTEVYLIPPDTWTDTQVSITPAAHENLTYTHLILADGTLIENVEGV